MRSRLGLHQRRRGLGRAAVEIGDRTGRFRSRRRPEFVGDRSGKTVFRLAATPAASAATSAAARAPLAIGRLIAAGHAGLFVAFVLVGFAVVGGRAFDGFAGDAHARHRPRAARRLHAARHGRAGAGAACGGGRLLRLRRRLPRLGGIVGQPFGLFGFDLGFGFDVERLFVVIGFLDLRRGGGSLRRQQRLGGFQRVHLFAAVDDERLLAG